MKSGRKKFKIRLFATIMSVLIFSLITTGCKTYDDFTQTFIEDADGEDTIRIGIFEPLSGSDKAYGKLELSGIELAHELYPTVLGKRVELVYADNKSKILLAENVAKELVEKEVDLVLGSYGNTLSLAGGEVFQESRIPAINITSTNPLVTKGNPYYFRVCIVDAFQGIMAAKYVYNDLRAENVVIMKAYNDDYGSALSQQFTEKLISMVGDEDAIIATIEYKSGTIDFSSQLERIKLSEAEVVYLPTTAEEAVDIVKQARSQGIDSIFLGTDLWHQDSLIEEGSEAAEGMVFTTYFDAESTLTETTQEFLEEYRKKYGEEDPHSAVALGYDAYLLAIDSIKRHAELEVYKPLRLVIQETKDFQGATGNITFEENGDPIKSVVFIAVENGEFIFKCTEEPDWE